MSDSGLSFQTLREVTSNCIVLTFQMVSQRDERLFYLG